MASVQIKLTLPPEMHEEVLKRADTIPLAVYVRQALAEKLERERVRDEAARKPWEMT